MLKTCGGKKCPMFCYRISSFAVRFLCKWHSFPNEAVCALMPWYTLVTLFSVYYFLRLRGFPDDVEHLDSRENDVKLIFKSKSREKSWNIENVLVMMSVRSFAYLHVFQFMEKIQEYRRLKPCQWKVQNCENMNVK